MGKAIPVEYLHVVPHAIVEFAHLVFLMLIRQPIKNVTAISSTCFILSLTGFAWPGVWTTLKPMRDQLGEISLKLNVSQQSMDVLFILLLTSFAWLVWTTLKHTGIHSQLNEMKVTMDLLQKSMESVKLAVLQRPPANPVLQEADPQRKSLETNEQPIDSGEVPQQALVRNNEPSAILDQRSAVSAFQERTSFDKPPATTDKPNRVLHVVPEPIMKYEPMPPHVDSTTISVLPAPPEPAERAENAISVYVEHPGQQQEPELAFGHWSLTLSEIRQRIESLASGTLQRLPRLDQRQPVYQVSLRRICLRLLMNCASFSTADFSFPYGFLGPPASVPYYPTGDLGRDRIVAFTTALDCLDELMVLLTGGGKSEVVQALSQLAQALSDLGLHKHASSVSGFALEVLRDLYTTNPDRFRSPLVSVQSLRANIFADLRQNEDAACAAEEAVKILGERGETQTESIYAMLNCAVLLGSVGRLERATAVAFELMEYTEEATNIWSNMVFPLCQLCVSNSCFESASGLALSAADKAIEASFTSSDANSKLVLAGALLTKSRILSSRGQNDTAYSISAGAVTLFRRASVDNHVFSLLLAHALSIHSYQLSKANRRDESYSTIYEAVGLWEKLHLSAPVATKRPLARALFELAKYRHHGADKRQELGIAEYAVSTFREVLPLDTAGLADALYLCADRMLELDDNRGAAAYAEESVQYFREANDESPNKYTLDLISSLSLASSCLACTERSEYALEYAKQAVELLRERKDDGNVQYHNHLCELLAIVVARFLEMGRRQGALPWVYDLLKTQGDTGPHALLPRH